MAVTATLVRPGVNLRSWAIAATLDADTTITFDHGMSEAPICFFMPIQQAPAQLSGWAVTNITATQITLTKSTGVGSGAVGTQAALVALAPLARVLG